MRGLRGPAAAGAAAARAAVAALVVIGALGGLPARADSTAPPGPRVSPGPTAPADSKVSASRLALLSRGINFSAWFGPNAEPMQLGEWITDADCALLRRLGFTFVRLPAAPKWLFNTSDPASPPDTIRYYDHAVRTILDAGLAVVVDPIHGTSADDVFEDSLARDPAFQHAVEVEWQGIARRYAAYSTEKVFFEVMNEPHISIREHVDASWWPPVQRRLAAAIRRGAPRNTIIATGEKWGGIDGLLELPPLADPDVVYSFHWYDPFTFTHQGAEWAGEVQKLLSAIPYPSSPEAVAAAVSALNDSRAKRQVEGYGRDHWDAARIQAGLQRAADWGKRFGVPVFCGEFGVYRKVSPQPDRVRWINDVRSTLEKLGIGWSMWDYDSGFGLIRYSSAGRRAGRILDALAAESLGLAAGLAALKPSASASASGSPGDEIELDKDPVAGFLSGATPAVSVPVVSWPRLWSRDASAAVVTSVEDISLRPITLVLKHTGPSDWAQSSGLRVPVKAGERYTLSGSVSLGALADQGGSPGTVSLEFVTYDSTGTVQSWNTAASTPGRSPSSSEMQTISSTFLVGPGVAEIEPRWSGSGPAMVRLGTINLKRDAGS